MTPKKLYVCDAVIEHHNLKMKLAGVQCYVRQGVELRSLRKWMLWHFGPKDMKLIYLEIDRRIRKGGEG